MPTECRTEVSTSPTKWTPFSEEKRNICMVVPLACFMPIRQLCAILLIPNRLCYNLSHSLSDASELYVKKTNSL